MPKTGAGSFEAAQLTMVVLRFATPEDTDELVDFNARLHEDSAAGVAVRNLMSGKHPTTHAGDFTVVEDINARKIVSSMLGLTQTPY